MQRLPLISNAWATHCNDDDDDASAVQNGTKCSDGRRHSTDVGTDRA